VAGDEAGVTDWLVHPFSAIYARTRVRAWLLRTACRWRPAPLPADEERRLGALRALNVLDTEREERFDRITRLAAALFDVEMAAVSLIDTERQWFKSSVGLGVRQTPRDASFCGHAILGDDVMVVPDALLDARFADSPLVTGHPHVRFYAGAPLRLPDGSRIGMLCLMDRRPRDLSDTDRARLRDMAGLVERELREPPGG
jgi:GAF domain-containing protein